MRVFILSILTCIFATVHAQEESRVSVNYQNTHLETILTDLSQRFEMNFYYRSAWIDTSKQNFSANAQTLPEILDQILLGKNLTYTIIDGSVYLTKGIKINLNPPLSRLYAQEKETEEAEIGLVFRQEFLNTQTAESDLENFVFEVGDRNQFVQGANSTLAGYVNNKADSTPLEGVVVFTGSGQNLVTTDENGFYSLSLRNGKNRVNIQLLGKKSTVRNLVMYSDGQLNIEMDDQIVALQEVTINAFREENVESNQMGISKIDAVSTKNVPVVLGERDIMKIAVTTSGVQTVGEGAAGFNVRGGKTDQNLVLINKIPIYNTSHFFGFFSVFNTDAISDLTLHKSVIPVNYDSRLSSVFELTSKKSSEEEFSVYGGLSPVSSKITAEIPLKKVKGKLLASGRGTYSDWVLNRVPEVTIRENDIDFYDLLIQYDQKINAHRSLSATYYGSIDKFNIPSDSLFNLSNFRYTNTGASIIYSDQSNQRLYFTSHLIYSNYGYDLSYDQSARLAFNQSFGVSETAANAEFNYFHSPDLEIMAGLDAKYYLLNPGEKTPLGEESVISRVQLNDERGLESALYLSANWQPSDKWSFYAGIRYSAFSQLGPVKEYVFDTNAPQIAGSITDTLSYGGGIIRNYHGPEPRFTFRYKLDDESSIKGGLARNRQYLHTLSNSVSVSPTDIWRLSSRYLEPQISDQVTLGYYRNLKDDIFEISVEGYFKRLQNLVDFKVGEEFILNPLVETSVLQGPGRSYGVELSVEKSGKLNGWINYTYARSFIQLTGDFQDEIINEGEFFPSNYDRPHTLNLVANYKFTRRISASLNVNYSSGRPVTFPVSAYEINGVQFVHYSDRNAFRIPDYFRVDIGVNLEMGHRLTKLVRNYWSFSIYNLLGRDNPYSVFFDINKGQVRGYQLVVFGSAIPTLSWNFVIK